MVHIIMTFGEKKMFGVFFCLNNKPREHNLKTLSKYAFKKCSDKIRCWNTSPARAVFMTHMIMHTMMNGIHSGDPACFSLLVCSFDFDTDRVAFECKVQKM